jgi:hypothetical protein
MKKGIRSRATTAVLTALCCMPAYAGTKLTQVTNDWTATNGCTVRSITGYGGYQFNVTVWGITCAGYSEVAVERHDHWSDYGPSWCEMKTYATGFYLTGNCGNYGLYHN